MYMTRIYSSGDGWRGGNGERLIMAGNLPYRSGDSAWTDGRIIYGWTGRDEPTRQWAYGADGIPLHNPEYGLYLFRGLGDCKRYADAQGWRAFANDSDRNCAFSLESFVNVMDMDIGSDGRAWVLSWKDAQYVLNTPHVLKYESGVTDKPEGRWIPMAVWQEQGDITVVKNDNGTSTQQRFREGSQRFSVIEAGNPTERDTAFTVTHGGISENRSLKEYAEAAMEAFNTTAVEKLGGSAYVENCVNSMTLRLVDGRIDSRGKLSLYILAQMKGFAFRDAQREGLQGSLVQSYSAEPSGSGRIHCKWEYSVNVSKYPVDATFGVEFTCTLHLHVDGETVEKVFESVSCSGDAGGYTSNWAFTDATNHFGGINHAREGGKNWIETNGAVQTYYSTAFEVDVHDGGPLNGIVFGETEQWTSSPALTINRLVDGFDAVSEEASWPFRMPVQDGYYAVITPRPIGISYGSLNYYDMRAYLGCFRKIYSPGGELVVDTESGFLFVRAITPIDEKGETYLIQTVVNTYDYSGMVYVYSKKEGVKPLKVPVADEEEDMWPYMQATNTRLRRMKNAGALKRM